MLGSKLMDQTNFCLTNKSCLILTQHFDCNEGYFRNLLLQHLALCSISEWLNMKISFLEVTQSMFLFSFLRAFYLIQSPCVRLTLDAEFYLLFLFSLSVIHSVSPSFCFYFSFFFRYSLSSFCIFLFFFSLFLFSFYPFCNLFCISLFLY